MKILVTGGAGFIGSFVTDELIKQGHNVTVYDNLDEQVHSDTCNPPEYLNKKADFIKGDVRDADLLTKIIDDKDIIFHFAAAVGVGQSMYKIEHYTDVNIRGTSTVLDVIVNKRNNIKKIIVAASMSSYGEGPFYCSKCNQNVIIESRKLEMLKQHIWEPVCKKCGATLESRPTSEKHPRFNPSIYAITKDVQEKMVLNICKAYNIPGVALRFFNVFGPRQSLNNPYTGVAAIFSSCYLNDNKPIIFEDGKQTRDFIYVTDLVYANMLAMEKGAANYNYFNVGTGNKISIIEVAEAIEKKLNKSIGYNIPNKYRKGDIRQCYADITKIQSTLGFEPKVSFEQGIDKLIDWLNTQESVDKANLAAKELEDKKLTI